MGGLPAIGDFESIVPLHTLLDKGLRDLRQNTQQGDGLPKQVPWFILPQGKSADDRVFGWSCDPHVEGDLEEGFVPNAADAIFIEDAPLVLPTAGSAFYAGDSLYFWAWLI